MVLGVRGAIDKQVIRGFDDDGAPPIGCVTNRPLKCPEPYPSPTRGKRRVCDNEVKPLANPQMNQGILDAEAHAAES